MLALVVKSNGLTKKKKKKKKKRARMKKQRLVAGRGAESSLVVDH